MHRWPTQSLHRSPLERSSEHTDLSLQRHHSSKNARPSFQHPHMGTWEWGHGIIDAENGWGFISANSLRCIWFIPSTCVCTHYCMWMVLPLMGEASQLQYEVGSPTVTSCHHPNTDIACAHNLLMNIPTPTSACLCLSRALGSNHTPRVQRHILHMWHVSPYTGQRWHH